MLRTIHFHGELAKKFGSEFQLEVNTPGEAIHALTTQLPGLEKDIREGEFVCVRGSLDNGVDCDEVHLYMTFGSVKDFHIMPAAVGRGRGAGKILIGIALIAATVISGGMALAANGLMFAGAQGMGISGLAGAAFGGGVVGAITGMTTLGGLALVGGSLMIAAGAAMSISAMMDAGDYGSRNEVDQRPGFLFNGAVNTSEQGGPVPLVFGRIRAGSVVVSAGISTSRIASNVGIGVGGGGSGGDIGFDVPHEFNWVPGMGIGTLVIEMAEIARNKS